MPAALSTSSARSLWAELEGLAGVVGMEDELDDAGAVAQVDEDQPAVVAAAVDPAGDPDLGVDPVAEHLAAPGVAVAVGAAAPGSRSRARLPRDLARPGSPASTGRCSPLAMSRSCAVPSASRISTRRAPIRSACLSWPLSAAPGEVELGREPGVAQLASPAPAPAAAGSSSATAMKTSRPAAASAPRPSASRIRSIPAAQPTAGVGGPPSCSIRPS